MARQYRQNTSYEEIQDEEKRSHGNTELPYGIAKSIGLDTTNMSPREVWEMLQKKGYNPKEEYKKLASKGNLSEQNKVKPVNSANSSDDIIAEEPQKHILESVREEVGRLEEMNPEDITFLGLSEKEKYRMKLAVLIVENETEREYDKLDRRDDLTQQETQQLDDLMQRLSRLRQIREKLK